MISVSRTKEPAKAGAITGICRFFGLILRP